MKKALILFMIFALMSAAAPASLADPADNPTYELVGQSGFEDDFSVDADGNLLWSAALIGVGDEVKITSMTIWLEWDNTKLGLVDYSAVPIHYLDHNNQPNSSRPLLNAEPDFETANEFCYGLSRPDGGYFEGDDSQKLFTLTFKLAEGLADETDCDLHFTKFQLGLVDASGVDIDKDSYTLIASDGCITSGILPKADCTVSHYTEALDGGFELMEAEKIARPIGSIYTAVPKSLEGFTFDSSTEGTLQSGTVTDDGLLSLSLYYTRNSYKLSYYIDDELYTEMWFAFEQRVVPIAEPAPPEGTSFSGWSELPEEMPAMSLRIDGSFITLALIGDADCNGEISAQDASCVLRHVVKLKILTGQGAINADVDHNGVIGAADATRILRYLVRLTPNL